MRIKALILLMIAGSIGTVSAKSGSAPVLADNASFKAATDVKVTVTNDPAYVQTDANGLFETSVSYLCAVNQATGAKSPLPGVIVTLPEKTWLSGTTGDDGTFSVSAKFTGKVVDETSQPIADAWVRMQFRPKISLVPKADGSFGNGGSVGVAPRSEFEKERHTSAFLTGDRLVVVSTSERENIIVSLFTMQGRQVFSGNVNELNKRSGTIELPDIAAGFYALKVTTGTYTRSFRYNMTTRRALSVSVVSQSGITSRQLAKAVSAAVAPDVLVAFADGYLASSVEVPVGDSTDITIMLAGSAQYKATGTPEHEGSMVKIHAKDCNFTMGQPAMLEMRGPSDQWDFETPAHTVSFTYDYWMDSTEITQKMYSEIMPKHYTDYSQPGWSGTYGLGENIASYHVNKNDAILFCNARSLEEGLDTVYSYESIEGNPGDLCIIKGLVCDFSVKGYRIPTEAEWEYACRGGSVTDFFWGKNYRPYPVTAEDSTEISSYVVWGKNSFDVGAESAEYAVRAGVASKKPNPYGLYDMLGSCSEYFHGPLAYAVYTAEEWIDPKPTTEPADTLISSRGGNWGNDVRFIRNATRTSAFAQYEYFHKGFRTVREVAAE